MHDVRAYAFDPKSQQWYRLVQDDEGRIAYVKVDESEIRKGDLRSQIPDGAWMVSVVGQDAP